MVSRFGAKIDLDDAADDLWAPTGPMTVELPNGTQITTFTGDTPHDGSQYDNGAYLFGFDLRGEPPVIVPGRCEYVVWIWDRSFDDVFANHPSFPLDPAGGTNLAFGLGINAEGEGQSSTFALELNSSGFYDTNPAADTRGHHLRQLRGRPGPARPHR